MHHPFDFHYKLRDYFRQQEKTWKWFSEVKVIKEQSEQFKDELLKNTYRMDPESEPAIYTLLHQAKEKLGIVVPITIYQSQGGQQSNAGIILIDKEAHLVISGPVIRLLHEKELLALIAHELSHILLFTTDNGDFEVTGRIITAIANDHQGDDSYLETARLFNLFTELYCDIGAYEVTNDADTVISTLVKIQTGLDKISPTKYLEQADEILAKSESAQQGESHPESYVRAKCVALFAEKKMEAYPEISKIIFGKPGLYTLNIFSKEKIHEDTRELAQLVIKPKWMQSELVKAHYRQYFKEFKVSTDIMITPEFKEKIKGVQDNLKDYYAYVMLDFALCDTEMTEAACGLILDLSEQLELEAALSKAIKKELKLSDKKFAEFSRKASATLNSILESEQEKTY